MGATPPKRDHFGRLCQPDVVDWPANPEILDKEH
jgi:hypothetical protein